jgi:PPOX class probable F420-dependent enzyme
MIPESHKGLLEGPVYAVATTIMPDGQPQSTVVWVDYDGTYIRMNTAQGRQKPRNIAQNPKVTLVLMDPQDPYHWMEIRGLVEAMTEEGGREHIEALSQKYMGQKYYGGFNKRTTPEQETRLLVKIKPVRVNVYPKKH